MARDSSPILRHQIDAGTYTDQDNVLRELVRNAHLSPEERVKITKDAAQIVRDIRGHTSPGIMEVFLAEYGLSPTRVSRSCVWPKPCCACPMPKPSTR